MNGIERVSVVWSSVEKDFESTCRYHKRFKRIVVKGTIVSYLIVALFHCLATYILILVTIVTGGNCGEKRMILQE